MSKIGSFFNTVKAGVAKAAKKSAKFIVENKVRSIVIGSVAAVAIGGTATTIAIVNNRHEHTPAAAVVENYLAPTCVAPGSYDEVIYCSECDEMIEFTTKEMSAIGHTVVDDSELTPTCTEAGLTSGKHCSACNTVIVAQREVEKLGHDEVPHSATTPTCTEDGWNAYVTCTRCDYNTKVDITAPGHDYTSTVTPPTCTEQGYTTHTCHCGDAYKDTYINALTHDIVNHNEQNPTCTVNGWDAYETCTRCEYSTFNERPAPGHTYTPAVTEPTCTEKGYTTYTCHCGDAYKDDYVDELNHLNDVALNAVPATCTETGLTSGVKCSRCNTVTTEQTVVPALNHLNDVALDAVPATCTETGLTSGVKCSRCNTVTAEQTITSALGHLNDITLDAVPATCTETGLTAGVKCSRCNTVTTEQTTTSALGHLDDITLDAVPATCTETGLTSGVKCSRCNTVTTEQTVVTALGHTEVTDNAVEPTCTETGLTEGNHCSVCDEIFVAQEVIPATGHVNTTNYPAFAPTCTENGYEAYEQCVCGHYVVEKVVIDALGHNPLDPVEENYTDPTCDVPGGYDMVTYCYECGEAIHTEHTEIPATGHTFGEYVYDEGSAKCGIDGTKTATCYCGAKDTVSVPGTALEHVMPDDPICGRVWSCTLCGNPVEEYPHDYEPATCMKLATCRMCGTTTGEFGGHTLEDPVEENYTDPTCTTNGKYDSVVYCSSCGEETSRTTVTVPALNHDYVNHSAKNPTCTEHGWDAYRTCSRCDYTTYEEIAALGHDYIVHEAKSPNCGEIGWNEYNTCSRCNYTSYIELPVTGDLHNTDGGHCTICGLHESTPGLNYSLNADGTYTVIGIGSCTEADIVIGIYNNRNVTSIDDYAFYYYYNLTNITIPNSVTSIGDYAFNWCSSLTSVTIPNSVTSIGSYAFSYCYSLTSITIGNSVTSIGNYAFSSCSSLTSITIPNSVTSIGDYAFYYCGSLTSITIPNSVTSIGNRAFSDCFSLTSVTIPNSVTSIGDAAFSGCSSLTNIYVDPSNTHYQSIDGNIYSKDGKTLVMYAPGKTDSSFVIPNSVTSIASSAFSGCSNLTSVTIPNSVTSIGDYAFYYFDSLTSITIPDSVTSIGNGAFSRCSGLTNITIPNSVTSIGDYAFSGCSNLTSVTIPNSVTSIGKWAFYWCYSATIHCEARSKPFGWNSDWDYECGYVMWGCIDSYVTDDGFEWIYTTVGITIIKYSGTDTDLTIPAQINGIPVDCIDDYAFYNYDSLTSVTIPDSVTSIGDYAFYDCSSLTSVATGSSVTSIGDYAFAYCYGLTNITIPNSVTKIGNHAFALCDLILRIVIPGNVTYIGEEAFTGSRLTIYCEATSAPSGWDPSWNKGCLPVAWGCIDFGITEEEFEWVRTNDEVIITKYSGTSTNVTIPREINGIPVTSIGSYTFTGTLRSVIIPSSITSVRYYAFYYCGNLTVYCEAISIPSGWDSYWFGGNDPTVVWDCNNNDVGDDGYIYVVIDGIRYKLKDGEAIVIGLHNYDIFEANIPSTIVFKDVAFKVTAISDYAFYNCSDLTSITIPDSVTSIGSYAFYRCDSLEEIYFNATAMNDLGSSDRVFSNAGQNGDGIKVVIGANVTKIPAYLFDSPKIVSVEFEEGSACTSIGNYAFYGCTGLTSITIPDNVISIGNGAFSGCTAIEELLFNATAMEDFNSFNCAFAHIGDNSKGVKVIIGSNVTKIPAYLFGYMTVGESHNITIVEFEPGSVCQSIGNYAFFFCNKLTSITIPDSVTVIGSYTFYGCSVLTDVYYEATEADWLEISISDGNNPLANATLYYYTENEPTTSGNFWHYVDGEVTVWPHVHTVVIDEAVDPTCTETGLTAGSHCSACGETLIQQEVLDTIDHNYVPVGAKEPNCFEVGWYEHTACSRCAHTEDRVEIPITNIHNTADGYCTVCGLPESTPGLEYSLNADGTYTVIGIGSCTETDIVIGIYNNRNVTSIDDYAFYWCYNLTSITIPDSVTSIGDGAFYNCYSLTSVAIPNSVTYIGDCAFYYCYNLTSINIPNSVTSIGYSAFYYCDSLTSITIPNSVTSIGDWAFFGCTSLTSVTIPNSVTYIGYTALCGSDSLIIYCEIPSKPSGWNSYWNSSDGPVVWDCNNNDVAEDGYIYVTVDGIRYGIKDGVASVARLFDQSLTAVNIASSVTYKGVTYSVTSIGDWAFSDSSSLTSITIPDSVTSIGDGAFSYCSSLTNIYVDPSNTHYQSIDGNIYSKDGKTLVMYAPGKTDSSFIIPNSVTSIGDWAFFGCDSLTSITIPNSVTSIGDDAFSDCSGLTSVTIPNSVTSIGDYAFHGCTSLTNITIPNSVTSIGERAFSYCDSLTSITIPNSVTHIGDQAFSRCSSLTSITIPDSVTSIGDYAFYRCDSLTSIDVNPNNAHYQSIDGNLYTKDGKTLIQYATGKTDASFTIPDGVTSIGDGAFSYCSSLTSITIPNSVTYIGDGAFSWCQSLTSVTIPDGVTYIGDYAFSYCSSLTSATIGNSVTYIGDYAFLYCSSLKSIIIPNSVTSIGDWAFYDCSSLTSVTIGNSVTSIGDCAFSDCSSLTSVTIGNSVTTIGNDAFLGCSHLTSITIPNSVTSIGYEAFYGCSSLTSIKYQGSKSEWDAILKGSNWDSETGSYTIIYDYAGE